MPSPNLSRPLLAAVAVATLLAVAAPAHAAGDTVILLLPPSATADEEHILALSELKRSMTDAGFVVEAVGEYNPDQDLAIVRIGVAGGVITFDGGDASGAQQLKKLLRPLYPDVIVEDRAGKPTKVPFPAGSLGVVLPGVVLPEQEDHAEPPPWDLHVRDVHVEIDGGMSQARVLAMVDERADELMTCWPKALARGKRMEGVVKVRVTVDDGGEPFLVSVRESPEDGGRWVDCVSEVYLTWPFPAGGGNALISVRFAIDEPAAAPPAEPAGSDDAPPADPPAASDG